MQALRRDVDRFLSEEFLEEKLSAFKAELAKQGKRLEERHRNPVLQAEIETMQELKRRSDREGGLSGGGGGMFPGMR